MEKQNLSELYTLNNPHYREILKCAADSCDSVEGIKLVIAGGAVVQLAMREYPHLLRPTTDIDIFPDKPLSERQKSKWADELAEKLGVKGYCTEFEDDDSCFPVNLEVKNLPDDENLLVSLTKWYQGFHEVYAQRVTNEFSRTQVTDFEGTRIRHQHLMDVIIGKIVRYHDLTNQGVVSPDEDTLHFFKELKKDPYVLDTLHFKPQLALLAKERASNIEDLGREDKFKLTQRVYGYKVKKDIYDICNILDFTRQRTPFDYKVFEEALEVARVNH